MSIPVTLLSESLTNLISELLDKLEESTFLDSA